MSAFNELETGKKALQDFFFRGIPSGFQQLGYSARQEGFVRNTVGLLYRASPEFGHDSVVMRGDGILESIRLARVNPGVVEFRGFRDIVMEEGPQNTHILGKIREQTIKEKGLDELVNIFGNYPNIPKTVVQVCVILGLDKARLKDADWLVRATHPLSTYISGGLVRTDEVEEDDFRPGFNAIAYKSSLEGRDVAVEMKHAVYGRTSERWRIFRGARGSVYFVGRVANHTGH